MKKILSMILAFCFLSLAQENITVTGIEGFNKTATKATTIALQSELIRDGRYHVVTRDELQFILGEQALQQAGAAGAVTEPGRIAGIKKALTGTLEQGDSSWVLSLHIIDIETGEILNSSCVTVYGNFEKLIGSCGYALKKLFGDVVDGDASIIKSGPIEVHEERVSQEVHVYEHKAGTHDKEMFVPCGFCQGRGYIVENGMEKDCPMCSRHITYAGPETKFIAMTGKWIK